MIMSQTGIILNVQHQLEDILSNQNLIVQNQSDMFEKLNDIEKRLMNVETCLIIQQNQQQLNNLPSNSTSSKLAASKQQLQITKSTIPVNNNNNNNNHQTRNNQNNNLNLSLSNLSQQPQQGQATSGSASLRSSPTATSVSASGSPTRLSQLQQHRLTQIHQHRQFLTATRHSYSHHPYHFSKLHQFQQQQQQLTAAKRLKSDILKQETNKDNQEQQQQQQHEEDELEEGEKPPSNKIKKPLILQQQQQQQAAEDEEIEQGEISSTEPIVTSKSKALNKPTAAESISTRATTRSRSSTIIKSDSIDSKQHTITTDEYVNSNDEDSADDDQDDDLGGTGGSDAGDEMDDTKYADISTKSSSSQFIYMQQQQQQQQQQQHLPISKHQLHQTLYLASGDLITLATDEQTGKLLLNETDIKRIFAVSKSRGNFAALLVQQLYARHERITSNVMGTRGKRQLSPRRMVIVKRLAFRMYPPSNDREEEMIWKKECVKAIDSKNRKVRINPGGGGPLTRNITTALALAAGPATPGGSAIVTRGNGSLSNTASQSGPAPASAVAAMAAAAVLIQQQQQQQQHQQQQQSSQSTQNLQQIFQQSMAAAVKQQQLQQQQLHQQQLHATSGVEHQQSTATSSAIAYNRGGGDVASSSVENITDTSFSESTTQADNAND